MALTRQVITTLDRDGLSILTPKVMAYKYPDENIVSGSLLTVESNEFCVLKSRGAVLEVYEVGQYPVQTPNQPIIGNFVQGFFGGASPWLYEPIYVSRAKLLCRTEGIATSREMAELVYQVDFYVHVDTKEDALALVMHMPFAGPIIRVEDLVDYAAPVVEQAVNQVIQVTALESVNERIHDICDLVKEHLSSFLKIYGIYLNDLKVLVHPKDERMREIVSLKALGLTAMEAVRMYAALKMAEKGLISAPNMAIGAPFSIGGNVLTSYKIDDSPDSSAPSPAPNTPSGLPAPATPRGSIPGF
jgi:membrane protease subunit (stomatin/prohibitin family)